MLEKLKKQVYEDNMGLPENSLVMWTSGNVSARDKETGYVVIKPSGVHFKDLTPESMVVVDLDGNIIEGDLSPSVDTESHLAVYKQREDVNGITHTHSPFATSFAVRGKAMPICTTTSAAVFGCDVPISDFVAVGEKAIGEEIVRKIGNCNAILIKNHGIFTIGKTSSSSLKAAVILEETAQALVYAMLSGEPLEPLSKETVADIYKFYQSSYGQKK